MVFCYPLPSTLSLSLDRLTSQLQVEAEYSKMYGTKFDASCWGYPGVMQALQALRDACSVGEDGRVLLPAQGGKLDSAVLTKVRGSMLLVLRSMLAVLHCMFICTAQHIESTKGRGAA